MADNLKDTALARALSDVVEDLGDLLQKEMRLARAELSAKLSQKLRAGVWMAVAAVLGICTAFLLIQALVHAIASYGLAMHWSYLIVAAALAAVTGGAYAKARADAANDLTPARTIHQVKRDIETVKEQFT